MTHVALLRAINLGGKNKLPMKDLAEMFADAKCSGAQTYIQSGNVVFSASPKLAARIPELISSEISKRFGYKTPVIVRTAEQLREAVSNNPFLKAGVSEDALHLMFLASVPDEARVEQLNTQRYPPDTFIVRGRDIYLYMPNGIGRSKLTNAYFDSKLATIGTVRNWRTVLKLLELMGG